MADIKIKEGVIPPDRQYLVFMEGGSGSGNHGHAGRRGQKGGSAPSGPPILPAEDYEGGAGRLQKLGIVSDEDMDAGAIDGTYDEAPSGGIFDASHSGMGIVNSLKGKSPEQIEKWANTMPFSDVQLAIIKIRRHHDSELSTAMYPEESRYALLYLGKRLES